jgi:hypothetical protein
VRIGSRQIGHVDVTALKLERFRLRLRATARADSDGRFENQRWYSSVAGAGARLNGKITADDIRARAGLAT